MNWWSRWCVFWHSISFCLKNDDLSSCTGMIWLYLPNDDGKCLFKFWVFLRHKLSCSKTLPCNLHKWCSGRLLPRWGFLAPKEKNMSNRKYIFKGSMFHCYVSFPEDTPHFRKILSWLNIMIWWDGMSFSLFSAASMHGNFFRNSLGIFWEPKRNTFFRQANIGIEHGPFEDISLIENEGFPLL